MGCGPEGINKSVDSGICTCDYEGARFLPTDLKKLADQVVSADKNIRYVAIVGGGPSYDVLEFRAREGVKPLTPDKVRIDFFEIVPLIMLGSAERLEQYHGEIRYCVIRYEKVSLMFFKRSGFIVSVSFEPNVSGISIYDHVQAALGPDE
jgi:hypothetical protein